MQSPEKKVRKRMPNNKNQADWRFKVLVSVFTNLRHIINAPTAYFLALGIHKINNMMIHFKYYHLREKILFLPFFFISTLVATVTSHAQITTSSFQIPKLWEYSAPLIAPEQRELEPSRAQKDPSVVFFDGKWHVFMTVKLEGRSAIEYCSFDKWDEANSSKRTILKVSSSDYYCAPQVFYFRPHKKWYLIYQMGVPDANKMWVAYSTTIDISSPDS